MYIVSAIIIFMIILNYILVNKLYSTPKNNAFFENVRDCYIPKTKYITPDPSYVLRLSCLVGVFLGSYIALCIKYQINKYIIIFIIIILIVCYLIEITRKITLEDNIICLSKALSKKKKINVKEINGMYIYSLNKKFLKKHALTTKLVIVLRNFKTIKFVLGSLDNRAVLNMMKENFGITDYKMYINK